MFHCHVAIFCQYPIVTVLLCYLHSRFSQCPSLIPKHVYVWFTFEFYVCLFFFCMCILCRHRYLLNMSNMRLYYNVKFWYVHIVYQGIPTFCPLSSDRRFFPLDLLNTCSLSNIDFLSCCFLHYHHYFHVCNQCIFYIGIKYLPFLNSICVFVVIWQTSINPLPRCWSVVRPEYHKK